MYNERLTSIDQLLPEMIIILCSSMYGIDKYIIKSKPYTRNSGGEWFISLVHEGCTTAHEYSLNELGITTNNPERWVTTISDASIEKYFE